LPTSRGSQPHPHVPSLRCLTPFSPPPRTFWHYSTPTPLALSPYRARALPCRANDRFRLVRCRRCVRTRNLPTPRTPPRLSSARGEDRRRPFFPPILVSLSVITQFIREGRWWCFAVVLWSPANRRRPHALASPPPASPLIVTNGWCFVLHWGCHGPRRPGPTGSLPRRLLPSSLLCATDWRAPYVSACPWVRACACPPSLTSGPELSVTLHVRPPPFSSSRLSESPTHGPRPPESARARVPH
jgi:hypothetical protein